MKTPRCALPWLIVLAACGAPPPAGGSTPPTDIATADASAGQDSTSATDASPTDTADGAAKPDSASTDTPAPLDSLPDAPVADSADAQVPDGQPVGDGVPPDTLPMPDLPPPDTAKTDATKTDTATPDTPTAPDAAPPKPGAIGIGGCTPTAPGWSSCVIQAFWQCIQPTAMCVKKKQSETEFGASWTGGGELACKIDLGASSAVCTGFGPDGKKCVELVETFDLQAKTATAQVTGPNGLHTMTFQGDTISVKCADGKTEFYADSKDLCSPLKGEGCPQKDEPPPGPGPCPPVPICKDNGTCPPDYTCDANTNTCLLPCPVNGPCPPCTQCDPTTNLCATAAPVPPPP